MTAIGVSMVFKDNLSYIPFGSSPSDPGPGSFAGPRMLFELIFTDINETDDVSLFWKVSYCLI